MRFLQVKMGNGDKTEEGRWKVGEKFIQAWESGANRGAEGKAGTDTDG